MLHAMAAASPPPRPNVLIFLIDDMGYSDLAGFGSPNVSTPHIDGLMASGIKFTSWVSAAPICTAKIATSFIEKSALWSVVRLGSAH